MRLSTFIKEFYDDDDDDVCLSVCLSACLSVCLSVCRQWTEKLVVFLLGIVQHQVADVSWHSLGIDQGFLDTMGQVHVIMTFTFDLDL